MVEARRHASCRVETCFFTPVNCQDARWEPHYYAPTDNLPHLTPPPPGSSPWWSYRTSDLPRYPGLVWLGDTMTLCNVIMIGPCHWLREGMAPHGWVVLGDTMTGTSTTVNRIVKSKVITAFNGVDWVTVPGVLITHCNTESISLFLAQLVAGVSGQRVMSAMRAVGREEGGAVLASVVPGDWT